MSDTSSGKPLVSVVIPLFNKEHYVERAVRSVLRQSCADLEVIVVDDGSTDRGAEVVASIADPRLCLIRQQNAGVSAARNRGIAQACAEFVAFVDADDEWHPEFLSSMWTLRAEHPQGSFFASSFEIVYSDGKRRALDFGYHDTFAMDLLEYMDCCMRLKSPIISSAVMISKALLVKVGMFPVGQKRGEDLDTWVRLLFEGPIVYCNRPLAVYWYGLPFSTCVSCQDVYLEGNRLLCSLEERLRQGVYQGKEKERVQDYIAWYKAGPVERLIASGRRAEARRYIIPSLRSKRLRKRYLRAYLKSFFPARFISLTLSTLRLVVVLKSHLFFND
jgi:glycosyltransferase involved in cell wall biosynthesis